MKGTTPPSQLRYLKKRYDNNEDYKQKQMEKSKLQYEKNKEALKEKYRNDPEYRQKILNRNKERMNKLKALQPQ